MTDTTPAPAPTVVVSLDGAPYRTEITTTPEHDGASHRIVADVPTSKNGVDAGPSPHDLLLASIGSCKAITVSMYARRKEWPLRRIAVALRHDPAPSKGEPERISVELQFDGDLTDEQIDRLAGLADRCPVHRTIAGDVEFTKTVARDA